MFIRHSLTFVRAEPTKKTYSRSRSRPWSTEDANGKFHPNKKEYYHNHNADDNSVCDIAPFPCKKLICETSAEQEDAGDNEIGQVPDHFIGELHRQQRQQQYERCHERNANNIFVLQTLLRLHIKVTT